MSLTVRCASNRPRTGIGSAIKPSGSWVVLFICAKMPDASMTDDDLYLRGAATLLASWEAYADGCTGAALVRLAGVAAAVFPSGPEGDVYNNALLDRGL